MSLFARTSRPTASAFALADSVEVAGEVDITLTRQRGTNVRKVFVTIDGDLPTVVGATFTCRVVGVERTEVSR